jgi:hypothetical protein
MRRKSYEKISPDKICLNHYITDRSLKIPYESIYNAQTYINLKPILVKNPEIIVKFYKDNDWLSKYILTLSERDNMMSFHDTIKIGWLAKIISKVGELFLNSFVGNWFEKYSKQFQIQRITANPLTKSQSGHVVFNDEMLAFHPDSPEKAIIENYERILIQLSFS